MKKHVLFTAVLIALTGINSVLKAQITITSADANATNAVGNVIINHLDTTTMAINIGSPGSTSWDFSALHNDFANMFTSVSPSSTPFFTDFPLSNVAFTFESLQGKDTAQAWNYSTQNSTGDVQNGIVVRINLGQDTLVVKSFNSPVKLALPLPVTFSDHWSNNYTIISKTYNMGILFLTSTAKNVESSVVDAWGNLKLPDGTTFPALRVRTDSRYSVSAVSKRTISYFFVTRYGTAVSLETEDTTADHGVIPTRSITWSSFTVNVGLEKNPQSPPRISLLQNRPNPVNSSTLIQYSIRDRQNVNLTVYNNLGFKVATLINEQQSAGSYEVNFEASKLKSGTYSYKLRAGNYTEIKKMIIIH